MEVSETTEPSLPTHRRLNHWFSRRARGPSRQWRRPFGTQPHLDSRGTRLSVRALLSTTVAFRAGALGLGSGIIGLGVDGGDASGSVRGRDGGRVDTSRSVGRAAVGSRARSVRSTRCRRRVCGPPFRAGDGEEGVREHREGDVPVPARVLTDLVVIEARLTLRGLDSVPFRCRAMVGFLGGSSITGMRR